MNDETKNTIIGTLVFLFFLGMGFLHTILTTECWCDCKTQHQNKAAQSAKPRTDKALINKQIKI